MRWLFLVFLVFLIRCKPAPSVPSESPTTSETSSQDASPSDLQGQETFPFETTEGSTPEPPLHPEKTPEPQTEAPSEADDSDPSPPAPPPDLRYFRVGSARGLKTSPQGGLLLVGGGNDPIAAFRWFAQRAAGGDIVILRTSGADGYNAFLHDLGLTNSVTTLLVDTRAKADSPFVEHSLLHAEAVFLAGGDQTTYDRIWRSTALERAVRFILEQKRALVGGTSAGMASLAGFAYFPVDKGVLSSEALQNPYHPYLQDLRPGLFGPPALLQDLITDTHFAQRDRIGRLIAFLARFTELHPSKTPRAIAANEGSALTIEPSGLATAFGGPIYFLHAPHGSPEILAPEQPLTWLRQNRAIEIQRLSPGQTFDLPRWQGGSSYSLSVDAANLSLPSPY